MGLFTFVVTKPAIEVLRPLYMGSVHVVQLVGVRADPLLTKVTVERIICFIFHYNFRPNLVNTDYVVLQTSILRKYLCA